jgi:hypothetical protein
MMFWLVLAILVAGCGGDADPGGGGESDHGTFVVASDFASSVYGWIAETPPASFETLGPIEGDSVAQVSGGRVVVIERTLGSVTVLADDLSIEKNCSVADEGGDPPNPHDVAFADDGTLWVARYAQGTIGLLDTAQCAITGTVDLASLADPDGVPEMEAITREGGSMFVSLELLENYVPTGNGTVAVIDVASHEVDRVIDLPMPYPFGRFRRHGETGELLLALVGTFGANDGAIVGLGAAANEPHEIVTEEALGGDVSAFAIVDATHGWAIAATDVTRLVPFDPSTGEAGDPLIVSEGYDLRDLDVVGDRLLVADGSVTAPGLRVFSLDGEELEGSPMELPLPPSTVLAL